MEDPGAWLTLCVLCVIGRDNLLFYIGVTLDRERAPQIGALSVPGLPYHILPYRPLPYRSGAATWVARLRDPGPPTALGLGL